MVIPPLAHMWPLIPLAWIIWIPPLYRLLSRIGWNRAWAFVAVFPPLGMILIWVIAFARWSAAEDNARQS